MTTNFFSTSLAIAFFFCFSPFQSSAQFENTIASNTMTSYHSIPQYTVDSSGEISEYIITSKVRPVEEVFNKALNVVIQPGNFKADYWIEYTGKDKERRSIKNEEILRTDEQIVFTIENGATNIKVYGSAQTGRPGLPLIDIKNMNGKKIVNDCVFFIKGSFNNPRAEYKEY